MRAARRIPPRRNSLLRVLAAAGFVVLIVAATALVVRFESDGHRLVVHAEIDQHGKRVAASSVPTADPAGTGNAICPPLSIAMAAALTGPDTEASSNIRSGVQLAIDKHNAANAGCQVQIKESTPAVIRRGSPSSRLRSSLTHTRSG